MGPLDAVIQLLLFVCFGVYVVMGLTFIIMGIIYSSDEGAVGSTGYYLIALGFLMLIIGGVAVFANLKKIWLILFVIELVNVVLFLVSYCPAAPLAAPAAPRGPGENSGSATRRAPPPLLAPGVMGGPPAPLPPPPPLACGGTRDPACSQFPRAVAAHLAAHEKSGG